MSRLEQLEHLPRPRHDRVGQSRQAADVNAVRAIRAAGLEPVQEDDLVPYFSHGDIEVAHVLELLGELGQLVVVRRENRFASDRIVQALRDGPRDGHAVVRRGAAPDLVEEHEAARGGGMKDRARFAHLDHERGLPAHQIVGRAHAGDAGAGRLAVEQHRAGAAAAFPAAVLAAGQVEVVAQDAEQRALRVGVQGTPRAVDVEFLDGRHGLTPLT